MKIVLFCFVLLYYKYHIEKHVLRTSNNMCNVVRACVHL